MENSVFMGWKCPQCGRVFSPYLHTCPYCTGAEILNEPTREAENKNEPENNGKYKHLTEEILTEWQYGPAEGGDE